MYLQITTRCNMSCAHCCFSATHHGEDMSRETLLAALKLAEHREAYLTIGGGEPTVHPRFWDFLGLCLAYQTDEVGLFLVTNGKRKDAALRLAKLAKQGVVAVELSQDEFHDPVHPDVVRAFTPRLNRGYGETQSNDLRGIRAVRAILPKGRALEEQVATESSGCACDDLLVAPDGTIYACGCKTVKFGTVYNPSIPDDWEYGSCACETEGLRDAA